MRFYRLKTCLTFTSPPSGFQRFFGGFCCLWRVFFKLRTRFEQFSSQDRSLSLPFPICKKQLQEIITVINTQSQTSYIREQENNIKQKEKSQTPGEYFRGLMGFAQWRYPPGDNPWHLLMGRGAFRQEVLLKKGFPELTEFPEVV